MSEKVRNARSATGDFGKGRGEKAVSDMKNRIARLKASGLSSDEVFDSLWNRHHAAVTGNGHVYEFAEV